MARVVLVGCGCRGAALAGALMAEGHTVRGSTRRTEWARTLSKRGIDARAGDPDRVATLAPLLEHAGVLCVLLGSAAGPPQALADLHGSRLDMLLLRALDSTVRGIVYEAAGSVDGALLAAGAERVRRFCETSHIPYAFVASDPDTLQDWLADGVAAVSRVLEA